MSKYKYMDVETGLGDLSTEELNKLFQKNKTKIEVVEKIILEFSRRYENMEFLAEDRLQMFEEAMRKLSGDS